ncbi:cytochrome P450 family protein [Xylogone sp. PMI_703]|nr:cytochrome P450 family protein [Xylogone sp. PMI_703]
MDQFIYLTFVLALSAFILYFLISHWRHKNAARRLGCKPLPAKANRLIFGIDNVLDMNRADKENTIPQQVMKQYEDMGRATFSLSLLGSTTIVTHDPVNIRAVLATQFRDFELGPKRRNNFFPMLGNGIFTADGTVWEHSRAMLRPQFAREQISDLALEERHVQSLLQHLPTEPITGWTSAVDLGPLFFRLTIDSATEFLFGESIHSQSAALSSQQGPDNRGEFNWSSLASCFDRGTAVLGARARLSDFYWIYNPKSFQDDCREIHRFADYCIQQALKRNKSRGTDNKSDRYIFLDELVKFTDDVEELRSQLLNILLAGRDTTAGLLGWTFWNLARHPAVFNKLRANIINHFGTYENSQEITFVKLKSCTYLQSVLNETLRLFPSVPLNFRQATRDTTLPQGGGPDGSSPIYVRAGQEVSYSVYVMHRRKDIWGEDANEFDPDRWESKKGHAWEYLPFNGGPRICLGQQFALTEAGYVIARIMQKFRGIKQMDANNLPLHQYSVTTAPKNVLVSLQADDEKTY